MPAEQDWNFSGLTPKDTSAATTPSNASDDYDFTGLKPNSKLRGRAATSTALADVLKGAAKKAGERLTEGGDVLRRTIPALKKLPEFKYSTERTTAGEKVGGALEPFAEFAGAGAVAGATKLTGAARMGAEATATYATAKSQKDPHAFATTLLAAVPGLAASWRSAPQWYAAAESTMRGILETATKGGEDAVKKAASRVLPLALDRSLLRATQGRWAKVVAEARDIRGQAVRDVLKTTIGDEPLPIAAVIDDLDRIKQQAQALVPAEATKLSQVRAGISGADTVQAVTIEPTLVRTIDTMQSRLRAAGGATGHIQARELVKFKRMWDRYVYGAKPRLDATALVQFKKEAFKEGADAIRRVIATTPTVKVLDAVDQAFHTHEQLYQLIGEVGFKETMIPVAAFGIKKQIAKRLLKAVVDAPAWRLVAVKTKLAIGDAVASGRVDALRRLVTPIIAGVARGRAADAVEPSAEEAAP